MSNNCGLCGGRIQGGSWTPDKCTECGAVECVGEWYFESKRTHPCSEYYKVDGECKYLSGTNCIWKARECEYGETS